ncbi:MAG: hypothetical protein QT01_C0009G0006 [archaeon GW2011_AR6]|nr:MAG: hypothetical protein QT01_C0009G0006 [archaeon GW2011_AR6]HIH17623.1 hypothetical protein [Nanoarchaeota archaeon]
MDWINYNRLEEMFKFIVAGACLGSLVSIRMNRNTEYENRVDQVYRASPYYTEVENLRNDAISDGNYKFPEVRRAIRSIEHSARKSAVEGKNIGGWKEENKEIIYKIGNFDLKTNRIERLNTFTYLEQKVK